MTSAVGAAFNEEAARRRNKGFKLQEWTLHRALRADDVRVLQLRILPADKVGKVVYFQVRQHALCCAQRPSCSICSLRH